jgi:hypothetical protein
MNAQPCSGAKDRIMPISFPDDKGESLASRARDDKDGLTN